MLETDRIVTIGLIGLTQSADLSGLVISSKAMALEVWAGFAGPRIRNQRLRHWVRWQGAVSSMDSGLAVLPRFGSDISGHQRKTAKRRLDGGEAGLSDSQIAPLLRCIRLSN